MKLFHLLLLATTMATAQNGTTDRLLQQNDFELADGRMIASQVGCSLADEATGTPVLVSIVCLQRAFQDMGIGKINDMIRYANGMVRNSVKGDYRPAEFKMAYNPSSRLWSLTSLFSVEDSGVVTKSLMALDFDASGNFLDIKRIY